MLVKHTSFTKVQIALSLALHTFVSLLNLPLKAKCWGWVHTSPAAWVSCLSPALSMLLLMLHSAELAGVGGGRRSWAPGRSSGHQQSLGHDINSSYMGVWSMLKSSFFFIPTFEISSLASQLRLCGLGTKANMHTKSPVTSLPRLSHGIEHLFTWFIAYFFILHLDFMGKASTFLWPYLKL